MVSSPITSWQIDGETMGTMTDFMFGGSKIISDGDYSHEIKRYLLLERKVITNLENIKKQRHYFTNKGLSSQSYGFSSSHVWMWELDHKERGVLKNWWFEQWCWRRLLRVPSTARRSNQSILKEISPGCSLEGLMLKLKFQYFGHLIWRTYSLEKTLVLRKIKDWRRRGWQRMRRLGGTAWVWASSGNWWWTGKPGLLQSRGSQRVGHDWATELNWLIFMDTHTYHLIKTKINYMSSVVLLNFTFWLLKTSKGKGISTFANSREEMNAWTKQLLLKTGDHKGDPCCRLVAAYPNWRASFFCFFF